MPFLLKHHFDPDLDCQHLTPKQQDDGSVDHYDLSFVQNVEAGCVIAEWGDLSDGEKADPRFVFDKKVFPAGKGTGIKRKHPDKLYAAVNGWVTYRDDKIVVLESLVVPEEVDFHTGNICFIGNLTIGGGVRTGFVVQGRDVTIQGQIEAASIEALQELNCRGGVKGAKEAFLESGKSMKLSFCEYATLKSGEDILVKGALMHSNVYAGRRLAVGGRLTGGSIYSHEYVYVGEQLGGGLDTHTSVVIGYNPILLYADAEYNRRIKRLHANIASFEKLLNKSDDHREEYQPKLQAALKELDLLKLLKVKLWEGIQGTEQLDQCKVLVPGVVKPGVEISIGSAYLKVDDFLEDVFFYYENHEVKIGASTKQLQR
ncbi:FapA family protein [uncultured Pseudodesulfovibrio sp.]|uniref:FapA family protein n=1 Tax=uncultured Pseudodesulfovibrio sp. TaxID=2035858 RepID=UPI0029C83098|nr:FapA family protein [uncultured Pseudodesulfovibrio sp.]